MSEVCIVHGSHSPLNLTIEDHHIIPQAWQRFWVPDGATVSGSLRLWDPRIEALCPTGHRNVHALIVKLMHYLDEHRMATVAEVVHDCRPHGHRGEFTLACFALERFATAGGVLLDLCVAGEWGEA